MFILPGLQLGLCKEGSWMNKEYGLDLLVALFLPTGNNNHKQDLFNISPKTAMRLNGFLSSQICILWKNVSNYVQICQEIKVCYQKSEI